MNIKETKELLAFITSFVCATMDAYKNDGKITLGDWKEYIEPAKKLPQGISGITLVLEELDDLDSNELNELVQVVKDESLGKFNRVEDLKDILAIFKHSYSLYQRNFK